jgi:hypothetical protein
VRISPWRNAAPDKRIQQTAAVIIEAVTHQDGD